MNREKADLLYNFIDENPQLCVCTVAKDLRSRMNVVFRLLKNGEPNEDLEKSFVKQAEMNGMVGLAGHRSVGGLRASIYNSLPIESVQFLTKFLSKFNSTQ